MGAEAVEFAQAGHQIIYFTAHWCHFAEWKEKFTSVTNLTVSWVNWDVNMFLMLGAYQLIRAKQPETGTFTQRNKKSSVPAARAMGLNETYESMEILMKLIRYADHQRNGVGDQKVGALLLDLHDGNTTYMLFLCLCNSHDSARHDRLNSGPTEMNHYLVHKMRSITPK